MRPLGALEPWVESQTMSETKMAWPWDSKPGLFKFLLAKALDEPVNGMIRLLASVITTSLNGAQSYRYRH